MDGSGGRPVRLADLRGHWAVLAFTEVRSRLAPLRDIARELAALDASLYGICRDATPTLTNYAVREHLPFVLLADETRQNAQLFGMFDAANEVIEPGIVLIDPTGVVRASLPGQDLPPSEILRLVRNAVSGTSAARIASRGGP